MWQPPPPVQQPSSDALEGPGPMVSRDIGGGDCPVVDGGGATEDENGRDKNGFGALHFKTLCCRISTHAAQSTGGDDVTGTTLVLHLRAAPAAAVEAPV